MKRHTKKPLKKSSFVKKYRVRSPDDEVIVSNIKSIPLNMLNLPFEDKSAKVLNKKIKKGFSKSKIVFWSLATVTVWYCIGTLFFTFVTYLSDNLSKMSTLSPIFTYFSPKTVILILIVTILISIFQLDKTRKVFKA